MNHDYSQFRVPEDTLIDLKKHSTNDDGGYKKKTAKIELKSNIKELKKIQRLFYADDRIKKFNVYFMLMIAFLCLLFCKRLILQEKMVQYAT